MRRGRDLQHHGQRLGPDLVAQLGGGERLGAGRGRGRRGAWGCGHHHGHGPRSGRGRRAPRAEGPARLVIVAVIQGHRPGVDDL